MDRGALPKDGTAKNRDKLYKKNKIIVLSFIAFVLLAYHD